ncbi:hypothetical protein D3C87_944330 [compost metagenome]
MRPEAASITRSPWLTATPPTVEAVFFDGVFMAFVPFSRGAGAMSRGSSCTISDAGLSSRIATKDAWRICPSGVHAAKRTSATSVGFTQCRVPPGRRRPGLASPPVNGAWSVSSAASWRQMSRASRSFQPVPTPPTDTSWPFFACTPSIRLPMRVGLSVRSV